MRLPTDGADATHLVPLVTSLRQQLGNLLQAIFFEIGFGILSSGSGGAIAPHQFFLFTLFDFVESARKLLHETELDEASWTVLIQDTLRPVFTVTLHAIDYICRFSTWCCRISGGPSLCLSRRSFCRHVWCLGCLMSAPQQAHRAEPRDLVSKRVRSNKAIYSPLLNVEKLDVFLDGPQQARLVHLCHSQILSLRMIRPRGRRCEMHTRANRQPQYRCFQIVENCLSFFLMPSRRSDSRISFLSSYTISVGSSAFQRTSLLPLLMASALDDRFCTLGELVALFCDGGSDPSGIQSTVS